MTARGSLELIRVSIAVNGRPLIPETTLSIGPGEVVTLMGPSGSGKSSLLAYICGTLDSAFTARGEIRINGVPIHFLRVEARPVGILFQDDLLFPHMTVAENLLFAIPRPVRSKKERNSRVHEALEEAGLSGYENRNPASLSGGQRARVALMRTLLSEPGAVLLDEPFSRLDAALRETLREFVFTHVRDRGLPTLLVTHDPADARVAGGQLLSVGHRELPSS